MMDSCVAVVKVVQMLPAFNYNSAANTDDGSCGDLIYGCIDSNYLNLIH